MFHIFLSPCVSTSGYLQDHVYNYKCLIFSPCAHLRRLNNKYVNQYGVLTTTVGLLQLYTRVHLAVHACRFSCTRVYMMPVFTFTRVYCCPYKVPACTRYITCVYSIDLMRVLLCYNTRRYNIEYTYTHFKVHAHAKQCWVSRELYCSQFLII